MDFDQSSCDDIPVEDLEEYTSADEDSQLQKSAW